MSHPLDTLMNEEIRTIFNGPDYIVKYDISCTVHFPSGSVEALFVTDFSLLRDYINKFSDVLSINAVFGKGMVNHYILPNYKQLECTVTLKPLVNTPEYFQSQSAKITEFKYRAVLYEDAMQALQANHPSDTTRGQADIEDIVAVKMQLINPLQDKLRVATFGGCIRNANAMDAIRLLLGKYSKVDGIEDQFSIQGIDIVQGYNTEIREHINVPHLTPIISLPKVINEIVGGLYSTGFNYYLQGRHWYIWSPFNIRAYEKAQFTITVINVPANKLAQAEKTFRFTQNQLIILCTGEVDYKRISDKAENNAGMGVRFIDANKIMEGFGEQVDNKFTINSRKHVNEVSVYQDVSATPEKINILSESKDRITTSYLSEYSQIAMRKGAFAQITWENSMDNLVQPGTPVRYIYLQGKEPRQAYGTVVALESTYTPVSTGMMDRRFANKTILSLFLDDSVFSKELL